MAWHRNGTCERCGECCQTHIQPDGTMTTPWPADLSTSTRSWLDSDITFNLPIFKWIEHPKLNNKTSGRVRIGNRNMDYVFSTQYGLVKSEAVPECPALLPATGNSTERLCGLHNTVAHEVWQKMCEPVPPLVFETKEKLDRWNSNCPSCSYTWTEIE